MTGAVVLAGCGASSATHAVVPRTNRPIRNHELVRVWRIGYRAHNGQERRAYVILPRWYGPTDHPPLPLVISPHGRGVTPAANAGLWGNLPARGSFAVVNPEGQGRRLRLYSWGDPGQIADLAKMPQFVTKALPWLRINARRIYAIGASMGGQEALLLLARQPRLLAGVVAFDAPTDLARRYVDFAKLRCDATCLRGWKAPLGEAVRDLAQEEIGGTPRTNPRAYAQRSPITYAREIAFAHVPVELWWSMTDRVVIDSAQQAGLLYRRIEQLNPAAPAQAIVGTWGHAVDMNAKTDLPSALIGLGLLPLQPAADTGYRAALASTEDEDRSARYSTARVLPTQERSGRYAWPLKPFDQQHPIRGGFGDPRTLFRVSDLVQPASGGSFSFHNGLDIVAQPGTPVYPVVSGVVEQALPDRIIVSAGTREFQYWHLRSAVRFGQTVLARQTVLGYIRPEWRHVHFSESVRGRLINPLLYLTPYSDPTTPVVGAIRFRDQTGRPLAADSLSGRLWMTVSAFDQPWPATPGNWNGFPIAPALLTWHLTTLDGRTVIPGRTVVDFRHKLPHAYDFWRVYAHGTYQNFPVVGLHYYFRVPGDFVYQLAPNGIETGGIAAGSYLLTVTATDMGGNEGLLTQRIAIESQTATQARRRRLPA